MNDEETLALPEGVLADADRSSAEGVGPETAFEIGHCGRCGNTNPADARFCSACGAHLEVAAPAARAFADPLIGLTVGQRYRIVERIGAGGMGAVYRVRHLQIGKEAAMKLLHGDLAREPGMVRRFHREARAVSRLSSPHTVSVFDFGESGGLVYLVMELLHGRDLGDILRDEGALSPRRVARLVRQMSAALTEAHGLGIVHRDLKPQNVFVCPNPEGEVAKILDFGLAKLVSEREESGALTMAGTVIGTPSYMSPEQIEDTKVGPSSDQYSLGVLTFQLLTGQTPYGDPSPIRVLHRHLYDPVPHVADIDPSLAALDAVVARAMSKVPGDRFSSVERYADALSEAVAAFQSGGVSAPVTVPEPSPSMQARVAKVGTRDEFEVFERKWRARRSLRLGLTATLSCALLAGALAVFADPSALLPAREREPNESAETATPLEGRTLVGRIAPSRSMAEEDIDRFALNTGASDESVRWVVSASPEETLALEVFLHDHDGRELASFAGAPGEPVSLDGLRADGRRVTVSLRSGNGQTGRYTVRSYRRAAYAGEEEEPNGDASVAGALLDGVERVGLLAWPGDADVYRLPSGDGGLYRYELSGIAGADLRLRVVDAQGTLVSLLDEGGAGEPESGRFFVDPTSVVGAPLAVVSASGLFPRHLVYTLSVRRVGDAPSSEQSEGATR